MRARAPVLSAVACPAGRDTLQCNAPGIRQVGVVPRVAVIHGVDNYTAAVGDIDGILRGESQAASFNLQYSLHGRGIYLEKGGNVRLGKRRRRIRVEEYRLMGQYPFGG